MGAIYDVEGPTLLSDSTLLVTVDITIRLRVEFDVKSLGGSHFCPEFSFKVFKILEGLEHLYYVRLLSAGVTEQ